MRKLQIKTSQKLLTALLLLISLSLFLPLISASPGFFDDNQQSECGPESEVCAIEDISYSYADSGTSKFDNLLDFMEHNENKVCILYFYSQKCSHCQNLKPFLEDISERYEDGILITKLDVSNPENVAIYNQLCTFREYTGHEIPLLAVNNVVLVGEDKIRKNLEKEIIWGSQQEDKICPLAGMLCPNGNASGTDEMISGVKEMSFFAVLPLILITGLGDGINPCAFAVLLFIMAFLLEISGNKRRLKRVTLSYIISFMIINIGLGVFYFWTSVQVGHPGIIRYIAIGFAVFAGLINLKDFFAYGKGFSLEIPKFSKKYIESLAAKASIPAALIMGGLVALLEAPCSVPIYLTILEVLKGQGRTLLDIMPHIMIYNIMFILPIAVLAIFIYYGAEAKALEGWRQKHRKFMKLSLAVILLALAGLMIFGVI